MKWLWLAALAACTPASGPQVSAAAPPARAAAAARPAPAPAVVTLPRGSGAYGTAHPLIVRGFDHAERWLAMCQARTDSDGDGAIAVETGHHGDLRGDAMLLYLALGGGAGVEIDALAATSPDGRYLAIVRGPRLELVDAETGVVTALRDADVRSDGRPGAPHRAAQFAGDRLLYIRERADGDRVVVHDPATHAEQEIATAARVWRLAGGSARRVQVLTVSRGAALPSLRTTLAGGECIGAPRSYSSSGQTGETPTARWLDLDAGTELAATAGDGGVTAVDDVIVRVTPDGALYFGADQVAPPACDAMVMAVAPGPRALVMCGRGRGKTAEVTLVTRGGRRSLARVDRGAGYSDLDRALSPATGAMCDAGLFCVATATDQLVDLRDGVVHHAHGDRLYVLHATMSSRRHEVVDVATGQRTPLPTRDARSVAGAYVLDNRGAVIDLAQVRVVRQAPAGTLRLSNRGRVLVAPIAAGMTTGPLTWQ